MRRRRRTTQTRTALFTGADDTTHYSLADHRPPKDVHDAMTKARGWHRDNIVLQTGIALQMAFANYGFRLQTTTGDKSDAEKLKGWWKASRADVMRFVRDTWEDWLILDNSVAFWRTRKPKCFVLQPERCVYDDSLGIETLKVKLDLKKASLEGKGLTADMIDRYSRREVELDAQKGEEFSVLKRGRIGSGFAWPSLSALFDDLYAWQSLQVGDKNWAYLARTVIRMVKIGHEIRNGMLAGSGKWFWNKQRSNAMRKSMDKVQEGILKLNCNFDHSIEYPHLSPERWDSRRYDGMLARILMWLGPVGQTLIERPNEYIAKMLRAWAEAEREEVSPHLVRCITGCFKPPCEILPVWSNRIFIDNRLTNEMARALLAAGPLSQTSALAEAGFDPAQERVNKAAEAALPTSQTLPIFDPAHGKRPAEPAGRPKEGV